MTRFIGQEKIKNELKAILVDIISYESKVNILFRAPSGYGKTTLGLLTLKNLGLERSAYYIPNSDGDIFFDRDRKYHFIDEVHTLRNPETIYPLMDNKDYCFFLASNETGVLKEPLKNRCINFIFEDYTTDEMKQIVQSNLLNWGLGDELLLQIVECSRNTPRVAKVLCQRLDHIFRNIFFPKTIEELRRILNEIIDIRTDGMTRQDEIYLEYLKRCGGRASLDTLVYGSRIDKETILREIEPFLLYKGLIQITSRGRVYVNSDG